MNTFKFDLLQWLIGRLFGTIPGPLLMGKLFDLACEGRTESCNVKGACASYNISQLSLYLFICVVIGKVSSKIYTIFYAVRY